MNAVVSALTTLAAPRLTTRAEVVLAIVVIREILCRGRITLVDPLLPAGAQQGIDMMLAEGLLVRQVVLLLPVAVLFAVDKRHPFLVRRDIEQRGRRVVVLLVVLDIGTELGLEI